MITRKQRIDAFKQLASWLVLDDYSNTTELKRLNELVHHAGFKNPWFTAKSLKMALSAIGESMLYGNLEKWLAIYRDEEVAINRIKTVAVIHAGNIPAVGFHDFLCVLISGHNYLGKLSSDDPDIIPELAKILLEIEPGFANQVRFTNERIAHFDAVIATGSNNTSRYFDYYFGKYPHIIRKNRNATAFLTGNETRQQLYQLGYDVFSYFGLGCRNVSKLFVPENYVFDTFFESIAPFEEVLDNYKFKNNYDYYKSIYLVNRIEHFDNGFMLITRHEAIASPPSVLYYQTYSHADEVAQIIQHKADEIQCVVGLLNNVRALDFGQAQKPALWDYADGVDTMKFLYAL